MALGSLTLSDLHIIIKSFSFIHLFSFYFRKLSELSWRNCETSQNANVMTCIAVGDRMFLGMQDFDFAQT